MPQEPNALVARDLAIEPTEADYESFCATVMETARGRWFLAEYARRHRHDDTAAALEALRRIEDNLRNAAPARQFERVRDELRSLAATIRGAKFDIGGTAGEFSKGAKVMALLDLLEQRIVAMIERGSAVARSPGADDRPDATRAQLTVITAKSPTAATPLRSRVEPPAVDLVAAAGDVVVALPQAPKETPAPVVEIHPDDMFVPFEYEVMERPMPASDPAVAAGAAAAVPAPPAYDPMMPVLALSADERIALTS